MQSNCPAVQLLPDSQAPPRVDGPCCPGGRVRAPPGARDRQPAAGGRGAAAAGVAPGGGVGVVRRRPLGHPEHALRIPLAAHAVGGVT